MAPRRCCGSHFLSQTERHKRDVHPCPGGAMLLWASQRGCAVMGLQAALFGCGPPAGLCCHRPPGGAIIWGFRWAVLSWSCCRRPPSGSPGTAVPPWASGRPWASQRSCPVVALPAANMCCHRSSGGAVMGLPAGCHGPDGAVIGFLEKIPSASRRGGGGGELRAQLGKKRGGYRFF